MQPTGQATLSLASLMRGDQQLARDTTVVAEADPAAIHLRELHGTVLDGPFEAYGSAPIAWLQAGPSDAAPTPAEPATFWLKSGASVAAVVALLREEPPDTKGTLNVIVEGAASSARLDAIRATLRDETGEITLGGFALKSARPTELRLEDGLLHTDQFEWHGPRSTFSASGSVGLVDGVDGRLRLTGDGSLALLTLLVPARIDGRSRFDLELSGPPGRREWLGTVGLEEGSAVVQRWRLALADWSGNVVLDRDRIDIEGLRGQFNGGEATIEGRFPVGTGTKAPQSLTVTVGGAFLDLPEGLRSQIDANLEWSHTSVGARLSGEATVTARPYREPATEIARIAAALIERSGGSPIELPGTLAATTLDVRLSTVGPLAVTNSVASVELLPELQLTGTLSSPALRGQVAVADDGRIQFGGRQYRLRDSRVEFRPDRGLTPTLAVSGETRVADYTVFLRLSGTADEFETALSSDPPLGERDLQTLLVTGQREALGRDSSSEQNAVGAVSGDVLGFAGQFLGFDAVTVSTTDDLALVSSDVDPALRLTVSKRIGRRFELVLSDNLDDNELTWVIIYRPRPGFEFRVLSRDNTEFTGEFRQEFPFGPGVSPPRTPPRRRQASDRVAAVTVSGEPGFAPAEVLTATSLRAGDEFDFSRWLEDRDRIARLYQQRGYFAARIVPTRRRLEAERDQQRVALDYRVTRGPRTVLLITGYAIPSDVEATLRQTWSESVLIDLLEADLTRVMHGHMVDVGFLRAAIAVDVDTSQPDTVTAVVKVDPGPRSTERHLAFSGNTVFSERELLSTIEASPGLVPPWRDPAPLLDVLQAAYAARGYLAMTATPGAVVFAGRAATLPIVVAEGPLARVASITVNGANRVGQPAAAAATGLSIGGTYVTGGERSARAALERYYRNLGYRDAVVELRSTVDAARGRVDVTAAVDEGAQHVVRAVQTTGVESTREATVERAVHIEPGSPASPAVADATRRRLYDVGTFRSAEVTFAPVGERTDATVPVDAIVTVQESKRFLLLYGLEVTNQYQSLFDQRVTSGGVAADLRDRNFLGRGWTLGAGVRYEPSFRSARLLNTVPRLGSKRIRTNVYADRSNEERTRTEDVILIDDETTVSIEQRWRPRTPIELSWGYQFNRRDLRFLDAHTDQPVIDLKGYLASLAGAIVVDRRDNMFDAKRGWLASTTVEWGLQPLGSDFDYLRTAVRASYYQPVGPLTLASNVRWGDMLAFRGQPPVSALDLFYTAGGTQTVRGYQQDSLSAYHLEVQGQRVPLGGTKLLVFNQEVRFPLFWLLSGAAFADAGNTFTDEKGIVFGDLAVGAGVGLRIRTPLAPVRIDLGFPVAGRQGQSGARWHFSIGQIF
jgi:outer membrane protein insertion porin family